MEVVQYVLPDGTLTGETEEKFAAHHANTRMHLAFSCYIFRADGMFLVTQRAHVKKVWPDVWTNSCCGHVSPGETIVDAIRRRAQFELGLSSLSDFQEAVSNYTYKTTPYNGIIDHEFCPIYLARSDENPVPNPQEVDDFKWMTWSDYKIWSETEAEVFSYWTKQQIPLIDAMVQNFNDKG